MHVRDYVPADAGACARVYHAAIQVGAAQVYSRAQRDDWSRSCPTAQKWRDRMAPLRSWVAEAEGRVIGFMSFREEDGYLDLAFVDPAWIGKGVAFALYGQVVTHAMALGLERMTVEASAQSHQFFTRQGWRETGQATHGTGAAQIITVLMDFDLNSADAVPHG